MKKALSITAILLLVAAVGLAQQSYPSGQGAPGADQSIIRGCVAGSEGNFTLTQEQTGSTFKLSGQDSILKDHVGHMVQINGHQKSDSNVSSDNSGAAAQPVFEVSDVEMVSDKCAAAASGSASAAPATTDQSASASASTSAPVSSEPAASGTASASTSTGTTSTDVNSQPSTTATVDSNAAAANPPVSTDTTASTASTTTTSTDVAAGQTTQADVTTGSQTSAAQTSSAPAEQTASADQSAAAPADQNAQANAGDQKQDTEVAKNNLPQTASPLPLLGLLGLGSLATGLVSRRKK